MPCGETTVPIDDRLRLLDRRQLPLWDFGWLDERLFAAPAARWWRDGPAATLAAVLKDPAYGRTYYEWFPNERAVPGRHGPFRLDRLGPGDFRRVPVGAVADEMRAILRDAEVEGEYPGPPGGADQVEAVLRRASPGPPAARHGLSTDGEARRRPATRRPALYRPRFL